MLIELQGLKRVNEVFDKLDTDLKKDLLREVTNKIGEKTKDNASKHTVTGEMEKSVFWRFNDNTATIGATAPHAVFIHFGTKPHIIEPNKKKTLAFVGKGGSFVFTKKVYHRGYKGDPFLYNAVNDVFKDIDNIYNEITKEY